MTQPASLQCWIFPLMARFRIRTRRWRGFARTILVYLPRLKPFSRSGMCLSFPLFPPMTINEISKISGKRTNVQLRIKNCLLGCLRIIDIICYFFFIVWNGMLIILKYRFLAIGPLSLSSYSVFCTLSMSWLWIFGSKSGSLEASTE